MTNDATDSATGWHDDEQLATGQLGVPAVVFFVISAAAPLTVLVSGAPLSIRIGGLGAPGAIAACGVVLILFAVGFTAMSRYIRNAGAFYAYAALGLGRPAGIGTALMTTFAYLLLLVAFYGYIAFFAESTFHDIASIQLPWGIWALVAVAIVGFLGYRHIDVGSKVLGVLLTAEVGLLLVLSVAVLLRGGPEPTSFASFQPAHVFFATGAGSLFVLGFGSYIGFEGTAIYAEEAKNPERTVPLATYVAIGFLAVFYGFTYWCVIEAFGVRGVMDAALADNFGDMLFVMSEDYLGGGARVLMRILIVTSFLACLIAFHNACARYLFALGRERLLPTSLGHSHPRTNSPYRASWLLSGIVAVAILAAVLTGLDPYLELGIWTYAAGVVGIVAAQAVCAIAVCMFFATDRRGHSAWRVLIAPAAGAAGLVVGVYLIVTNFEVVSGYTGWQNWVMLAPTPVLFLLGCAIGLHVRHSDPERYARLARR